MDADPCARCAEPIGERAWIDCGLCRKRHHDECWSRCANCGSSSTWAEATERGRTKTCQVGVLALLTLASIVVWCCPLPISFGEIGDSGFTVNGVGVVRLLLLGAMAFLVVKLQGT